VAIAAASCGRRCGEERGGVGVEEESQSERVAMQRRGKERACRVALGFGGLIYFLGVLRQDLCYIFSDHRWTFVMTFINLLHDAISINFYRPFI
jgi:hypothetical protein